MHEIKPVPTDLLTVGEVACRTGVAVSALHFYEREGLISSTRTSGGQRRFARHVIRRVSVIQVAKRMGGAYEAGYRDGYRDALEKERRI